MLSFVLLALIVGSMTLTGCSKSSKMETGAPADLNDLLKAHSGHVLILLLGVEGCPGTAKATEALDEYMPAKPHQVSVVRLDVPLTKKATLELSSEWKHAFPRFADTGRKIADELDFFYYPTLYVFDGQGEKRYVGGYDKDKIAAMAREILAEKPGAKKKIYTLPMPSVGEPAPAFSGNTLAGKAVSKDSLMGKRGLLLIFSRTSCPFSMGEMPQFKELAESFHGKGVNVVIVNQQEELDTIKPVYEEKCAGVPVIWDTNGDICKSFGVDAVPFFFLLNGDGKIISRRSFTRPAAANSVSAMLGLEAEKTRFKPTEGG